VEVLAGLGITEQSSGCPIHSSMDVIQIGETKGHIPVYIDRIASQADGIILIGRVKPHTDFQGQYESGLMKMAAIGLGKHAQALLMHSYGIKGIRDMMPDVAEVTLREANILYGIAIAENALEQTALIKAIQTEEIMHQEKHILEQARSWMPSLPVQEIDLLVVDEMGKDYSGTGLDTNIIGRTKVLGVEEHHAIKVKYIHVSDLSEASHGNALGTGLADLTTRRLFDKINMKKTYENVITSTFLERAKIPMVLDSDREALHVALRANWGVPPNQARIVRISNTLHIEEMYVSEPIFHELKADPRIVVLNELQEMEFDEKGYFKK
jgi:hypothetical protein